MSNRKMKSLSDLPTMCYAEMDGKLCVITRGEKGWKRASISAENSAANQELATLKNRELGVSPEDARLLVTGAVVGWDAWITPTKKQSAFREIFEVEISRTDPHSGYSPTAIVKLPATWAELQDALDKLRITDDKGICKVDVWDSQPECMEQMIPKDANLFELNHLAERLAKLDDFEMCAFEGLMTMDAVRTDYATIPVERLINMTYSLADCQIAYEAHDDEALGKFYAENDFIPELETLSEKVFPWLDYEKIGQEMRIAEGGVFTSSGYVVHSGEMSSEYSRDKLRKPEKPDYVFKLEIAALPSSDEPNDKHTADLKLPATTDDIRAALSKAGGESLQECVFYGFDSIMPRITGELFADMENFDVLNELAEQVRTLEQRGGLTTFKAMISVPTVEIALEDALDLSYQTDGFSLRREVCSPDDYARSALTKLGLPLGDELCEAANLYRCGQKLLERDNAIVTDYGALVPPDGQTLEQCLEKKEPEQSGMCQSMT